MSKTNPPYEREFREGAVELLRTSGKPLKQVARELGVCPTSLRRWRDALLGDPAASAKELWDENQRLRKENDYLRRQI